MFRTLSVLFIFSAVNLSVTQTLRPDDGDSKVHFTIKNLGIKTGGDFNGLNGSIIFDPNAVSDSRFNVSIQSATIDTDNSQRDKSLRTEYFETGKYPEIRMASTKIEKTNKTDEGYYYFTGTLTIKGITKEVSFPFKAQKVGNDWAFTGDFEIDRLDYNVGKASSFLSRAVNVSLKVKATAN